MMRVSLVLLLAILIRQSWSDPGAEASSNDGFVKTKGVQFILDDHPYYFNGFNAYWLMYESTDPSQRPKVSAVLHDASHRGLTVARAWAFNDGDGYRALQPSPGSYNEDVFKGLDYTIAEARKYGMKVILSFINNYSDFGGKKQYVEWAKSQGQSSLSSEDDFFTNSLTKTFYKNHINTVLNRVNTITNVKYKDDPTIMAWELMNEPQCRSDPSLAVLQGWITEMAAYVKSIDSNHLLEVGLEGFYDQSSPQGKSLNPPVNTGTDFIGNNRVPEIDFATVHSYPEHWFPNTTNEFQIDYLNRWIDAHIQDAEKVLQKPVVLAEFGKSMKEAGYSESVREKVFRTAYDKIYESAKRGGAAGGGAFWQLLGGDMDNFQDGYGIIMSQDSSTVNLISQHSQRMAQIRKLSSRI